MTYNFEPVKKEFQERFVRSDGLMNKYTPDEDGDPDSTANAVLSFLETATKSAYAQGRKELLEYIKDWMDKTTRTDLATTDDLMRVWSEFYAMLEEARGDATERREGTGEGTTHEHLGGTT